MTVLALDMISVGIEYVTIAKVYGSVPCARTQPLNFVPRIAQIDVSFKSEAIDGGGEQAVGGGREVFTP
jgi:hypothetical protein